MAKEDEAAHTFHHANSEANLGKRLQHYEWAHHACEHAMARYDQRDLLLRLLRDALPLCSPWGRLRTVASVRSELTLLLDLIAEIDDAASLCLHPVIPAVETRKLFTPFVVS